MPREHFSKPIRDGDGIIKPGSSVRLLEPNTTDLIPEPIYVDATGTDTRENPWVSEDGVVDFYLDKPRIVDIGITPEGSTSETVLQDQSVGDEEVYKETFAFTVAGVVSVGVGNLRFYIEDDCVIETVRASVGAPPTGSDLVVDVNLNGASVFTTSPHPTVATGANTGVAVPDTVAAAAGDYLTFDIDQVGSATPGSDLVIQIRTRRTA